MNWVVLIKAPGASGAGEWVLDGGRMGPSSAVFDNVFQHLAEQVSEI